MKNSFIISLFIEGGGGGEGMIFFVTRDPLLRSARFCFSAKRFFFFGIQCPTLYVEYS